MSLKVLTTPADSSDSALDSEEEVGMERGRHMVCQDARKVGETVMGLVAAVGGKSVGEPVMRLVATRRRGGVTNGFAMRKKASHLPYKIWVCWRPRAEPASATVRVFL